MVHEHSSGVTKAWIDRGGSPYDTDNFVLLAKDMRAAFGKNFGEKDDIS